MASYMDDTLVVATALKHLEQDKVFPFLLGLPEQLILNVIKKTREGLFPVELRPKVATKFLVKESIEAAREFRERKPNYIDSELQKMLRISVALMREMVSSKLHRVLHSAMTNKAAAHLCLELYDLISIDGNQGSVSSMLRNCGKLFSIEEMKEVLNEVDSLIVDKNKRLDARNLLCTGYIEYNGAELAFCALGRDDCLSTITAKTPADEIISNLERVLVIVDSHDQDSIDRAMVLFRQACHFPGEKQAMEAVKDTRPDLVGVLK